MGRIPREGRGKRELLGGKTVLRKNHPSTSQAKPAFLTSWAFVELTVWNGHSAWGSGVPSNAVALSTFNLGVKMASVERNFPAEWHGLPPVNGTKKVVSVLAKGSFWKGVQVR